MNLPTTLLFYVLLGSAVAVAVHQSWHDWFSTCTAVAFWPLYLPALLQGKGRLSNEVAGLDSQPQSAVQPDEFALAIQQVEAELDGALRSLDGWSTAVLAREQDRFAELRAAWRAQADRIRELDRLLQQPAFAETALSHSADSLATNAPSSERGRRANIARLAAVRQRLHNDLLATLSKVRELVTMIHLAKYTGAPASRAEELVLQIATSVEGLSEVANWRDDDRMAS